MAASQNSISIKVRKNIGNKIVENIYLVVRISLLNAPHPLNR